MASARAASGRSTRRARCPGIRSPSPPGSRPCAACTPEVYEHVDAARSRSRRWPRDALAEAGVPIPCGRAGSACSASSSPTTRGRRLTRAPAPDDAALRRLLPRDARRRRLPAAQRLRGLVHSPPRTTSEALERIADALPARGPGRGGRPRPASASPPRRTGHERLQTTGHAGVQHDDRPPGPSRRGLQPDQGALRPAARLPALRDRRAPGRGHLRRLSGRARPAGPRRRRGDLLARSSAPSRPPRPSPPRTGSRSRSTPASSRASNVLRGRRRRGRAGHPAPSAALAKHLRNPFRPSWGEAVRARSLRGCWPRCTMTPRRVPAVGRSCSSATSCRSSSPAGPWRAGRSGTARIAASARSPR